MYEQLILVDENDQQIGVSDKVTVHVDGLLHRAFSVFVFNRKGELLIQKRADEKYHSAGLWSNTVCSHPRPGETTLEACQRRLYEEMGMKTDLHFAFSFLYKTSFENGLIEHELDHVYIGTSDLAPVPEKSEVSDYKYVELDDLNAQITKDPGDFTVWLRICLPRVKRFIQDNPDLLSALHSSA